MAQLEPSAPRERRSTKQQWPSEDLVTQPAHRTSLDASRSGRRPYLTVVLGRVPGELFEIPSGKSFVGRSNDCRIQLSDPSLSRRHVELQRIGEEVHAYDLSSTNGTWVNAEPLTQRVLHDGDKLQLGPELVLRYNLKDVVDESFQRNQFEAMTRDGLTGCYNRAFFDNQLAQEVAMARSTGLPLAVAMLDLDHFKSVNDTYGHGAGDQVLQDVAQILLKALRSYDVVARYGGEEFGVLMRGADHRVARRCMERVRIDMARHASKVGKDAIKLTVSVGIASTDEATTFDETALLTAADMRMYVAKRDGRNRVIGSEISFSQALNTDDMLSATESKRPELAATLPRGRVRLRPLSELSEAQPIRRVTGQIKR